MKQQKRRKRHSKPPTTDPVILLSAIARLLTECEKTGIRPRMKHGILFTDAGFVLPVKDKWAARPLKKH